MEHVKCSQKYKELLSMNSMGKLLTEIEIQVIKQNKIQHTL